MASRWLPAALFALTLLVAFPAPAIAGEHEDFAFAELRTRWDGRLEAWERSSTAGDETTRVEMSYEYFDAETRLVEIERVKALGQSYSEPMRAYLKDVWMPRLAELARRRGVTLDKQVFLGRVETDRARLKALEGEMVRWWADVTRTQPKLRRVIQFFSFARSETLASGSIGDWNPASAADIQASTVKGLTDVLEYVESPGVRGGRVTVDTLKSIHKQLLGKAEHFFSAGGRINDIKFRGADGRETTIGTYLSAWEAHINAAPPGLESAAFAYQRFLHLHPFGDSNGRVAELVKQIMLDKAGLPPLITREKTAVENYLFQEIFGTGNALPELIAEAQESRAFAESWLKALEGGWSIKDVKLSGSHVVAEVVRGGEAKLVIGTRAFEVARGRPLPPVKGMVVLAEGVSASEASLRLTLDGWQTHLDVKPEAVAPADRMGSVGMRYNLYSVPLDSSHERGPVEFALHYTHPSGQEVWFNNGQRNYAVFLGAPSPCFSVYDSGRAPRPL